jgi:hypothetical protein
MPESKTLTKPRRCEYREKQDSAIRRIAKLRAARLARDGIGASEQA